MVFALVVGGANPALADDKLRSSLAETQKMTSSVPWMDADFTAKKAAFADPTARDLVENKIGVSGRKVNDLLSNRIALSLNLESSNQPIPDELISGLSEKDAQILGKLPSLNEETGEVTLPNPETREIFSMRAENHTIAEVVDGVARTQDKETEDNTTAVSHVTADESGQIIGIINGNDVSFMDFSYTLPDGYSLEARSDGGFNLVSKVGIIEGEIEAPWALDATGKQLSTKFEIVDGSTLRQYVDTEGVTFPVALDPSWSWWLVTAGKCAVSIAPLLATGGGAIAARAPKLISFINKLSKSRKIAAAVRKVGGSKKAAVAAIKKAVLTVRGKLPRSIASKLPSPKLTSKDRIFIAAAWPFLVDNFWDLIGIGSCYSLVRRG